MTAVERNLASLEQAAATFSIFFLQFRGFWDVAFLGTRNHAVNLVDA